jgi:hypothetical protein
MTQENIAGPDQNRASPLAAMSEAKEHEKVMTEPSDLLDQIEQTKGSAEEARFMIDLLGDEVRNAADSYGVEDNLGEAQSALNCALASLKASLALLEFGEVDDDADEINQEDSPALWPRARERGLLSQRSRRPAEDDNR